MHLISPSTIHNLGTVIVEMKVDVQYSEMLFLGNFQYSNQKQTGDNRERELGRNWILGKPGRQPR